MATRRNDWMSWSIGKVLVRRMLFEGQNVEKAKEVTTFKIYLTYQMPSVNVYPIRKNYKIILNYHCDTIKSFIFKGLASYVINCQAIPFE